MNVLLDGERRETKVTQLFFAKSSNKWISGFQQGQFLVDSNIFETQESLS